MFGKLNATLDHSPLTLAISKHMVSLRGSKFGSRVAMLCCNPAYATRPGPPMGMQMTSRFPAVNTSMGRGSIGGPF